MIRINLKEVIQRIYRDTSRTASLRTTTASKKEAMFYEERVLGGENEDVEHDAAFRGDENIEAVRISSTSVSAICLCSSMAAMASLAVSWPCSMSFS